MAGVSQTQCNGSLAVVDEVGAETSAIQEVHSPSSTRELNREETPSEPAVQESDSWLESKTPDRLPEETILGNDLKSSEANLMRFAEILYKCTLCTSLPSILTSKDSFLAHVTKEHLTKQTSFRDCSQCDLKFGTDEDLRAHVDCTHSNRPIKDTTDSDIPSSPESVSSKPTSPGMEEKHQGPRVSMYVLNSPAVIPRTESPNPTKKDFPCNKYQVVKPSAPVVKVNDLPTNETLSKIQKLTDQIVQSQIPGTQANLLQSWASMSGFTPEFGRYTKLVREGGNIVYFCQVCNWKCQVKVAFQAHCNGPHHNNKVRIADQNNPHRKRGGTATAPSTSPSLAGGSPSQCRSPSGLLIMVANKSDSENQRSDTNTPLSSQVEETRPESTSAPSVQDQGHSKRAVNSSVPDMPFLQGLLYNQRHDESRKDCNGFTFQRRSEKERTQENGNPRLTAESFFEKAKIQTLHNSTNGKHNDGTPGEQEHVSVPRNKRKRPTPVSLRNQAGTASSWCDSDSDDCTLKSSDSCSSDSDQSNAKKYKESDSPVQRDDFHSRLMKRIVSTPSQKSACDSQHTPAQSEHASPFLHNSFRNRLFASAFGASFGSMYGWYGQPNPLFAPSVRSSDENGPNDAFLGNNPFKNSIHYGSKLFPNNFTQFNYSGKHRQISEALAARKKSQSDTSPITDEDTAGDLKDVIKEEPTDCGDSVFRCSMCEYTCQDIHNYRHHFMAEHGIDGADSLLGESQFSSMNEGWKMSKIRDCLPGELSIQIPANNFHYRSHQCF